MVRKVGPLVLGLFLAGDAFAGMPVFTLGDVARLRIDTLSFFGLVLLLVAFGVQRLWNALRRDFERLPRLSYRGALAGVALWGLAMHLVLGMISGARELMTPGAWVRDGATYRLGSLAAADAREGQLRLARESHLERLRVALWDYARQHDGHFPPDDYDPAIDEHLWQVIDSSGMHYVYLGGSQETEPRSPLAFEPGVYGRRRLVLWNDGEIDLLSIEQIHRTIDAAQKDG